VAAVAVLLGQGLAGEDVVGHEDAFTRSISDRHHRTPTAG
jgi:hypothetical protein